MFRGPAYTSRTTSVSRSPSYPLGSLNYREPQTTKQLCELGEVRRFAHCRIRVHAFHANRARSTPLKAQVRRYVKLLWTDISDLFRTRCGRIPNRIHIAQGPIVTSCGGAQARGLSREAGILTVVGLSGSHRVVDEPGPAQRGHLVPGQPRKAGRGGHQFATPRECPARNGDFRSTRSAIPSRTASSSVPPTRRDRPGSAGDEDVANMYGRVGFRRIGTASSPRLSRSSVC
jgi:hypothetical protein